MLRCAIPLMNYVAAQKQGAKRRSICAGFAIWPRSPQGLHDIIESTKWGSVIMRGFLLMLGIPDMAMSQMLTVVALAIACAFALAWIADAILDDGAYGVVFNTIILLVGAVVGILVWRKLGYVVRFNPFAVTATVAMSSGLSMLMIGTLLRRWI